MCIGRFLRCIYIYIYILYLWQGNSKPPKILFHLVYLYTYLPYMDPGGFLGFKPVANQFQTRSSNRDRTRWRGLWMTGLKKLSFQIREDLLSISAWANWQAIFLSHLDKRHLSKSNVANPWTFLIPQFHWNILEAPWPIIRSWTIMAQGNESARRAISGTARVFNAGHRDAETQTAWDDKKPDPLAA